MAGSGRSGSTIFHNILGQVDGFFPVGEIRYIWERGALKNRLCGCGKPFRECEFWNEVMDRGFGGMDNIDPEELFALTESFRIRNLPLTWVPPLRRRELDRLSEYLDYLSRLYAAIEEVSGCRVIVDSTKNPSYGYLLERVAGLDLYHLHFVRDAPAVSYSWSQKKEFQPGDYMARKGPVKSALQWDARNLSAELFLPHDGGRWMSVRYEDMMVDPRGAVRRIVDWLGEPDVVLPFTSEREVQLDRPNHSVFGNEVRFKTGPVTLRLDERWREGLDERDALKVKALTWPLRARYGYLTPDRVTAGHG
jgi:hypothetical protein